MPRANKTIVNTVGGVLSPLMHGRVDLQLFQKSLARCDNFVVMTQGGARFRNGNKHVNTTRLNRKGILIPFQFNDEQAYLIEATDRTFRFYKDEGAILEPPVQMTSVANSTSNGTPYGLLLTLTKGDTAVFVKPIHGLQNGDEILIEGVDGPTELNGRFFHVQVLTIDTFTLTDVFGDEVFTVSTPGTGGTFSRVYEIDTPYEEADLEKLQWAQNADTMYIVCRGRYDPRKLTRAGHTDWTLADRASPIADVDDPTNPGPYVRTEDPFNVKEITNITKADPGVLSVSQHGLKTGDTVYLYGIDSVVSKPKKKKKKSTTPIEETDIAILSDRFFTIVKVSDSSFSLKDSDGSGVNTTNMSTYAGTGTCVPCKDQPGAVTFLDTARLLFAGTDAHPETLYASKAPSEGNSDFDNFKIGIRATDGFVFTLAPVHGKVDSIQWVINSSKFLFVGTFGSIRRIYGATEQEAISPTSFTSKSVNGVGCTRSLPLSDGDSVFYIQRGNKSLRSIEYDFAIDSYATTDRNLVTEHLTRPQGLKQIVEQLAVPDVIWVVRNDGVLLGHTHKEQEKVSGWHVQYIGGSHIDENGVTIPNAKVLWLGTMLRPDSTDQLWMIVERHIDGGTVRSVEFLTDEPVYPVREDFFTGDKAQDQDDYVNRLYEVQKGANHLDMMVEYDGSNLFPGSRLSFEPLSPPPSQPGTPIGLLLTLTYETFIPAGTVTSIRVSDPVFTSSMVGRELWKKYDVNGKGGGRARITAFVDSTLVEVLITVPFDTVADIPAGMWALTTDTVSGLNHFDGEKLTVLMDGGTISEDKTVSAGAITLDAQASRVMVGYKYQGVIETLNIDAGGVTGSAQSKTRNLVTAVIRLFNTLGTKIGTDFYNLQRLRNKALDGKTGRPSPPFSGNHDIGHFADTSEYANKKLVIVQDNPLPCTVLSMDLYLDVTDE